MAAYELSGKVIHSIGDSTIVDTQGTGTVHDSHVLGSQLIRASLRTSVIHGCNIMSSTISGSHTAQCGITSSTVSNALSSGSQISSCKIMSKGGRLMTSDCQLIGVDTTCHKDSTMYLSEVFNSRLHFNGNATIMRSFISGVSMVLGDAVIDGAHITQQSQFASFDHDGHMVTLYRSVRGNPSMMVHYKGVTCQVDSITLSAIGYGKVSALRGVNDMGVPESMHVSPDVVGKWAQNHPDMFIS